MGKRDRDIAIVGPCAAGKSTLVDGLKSHGYHARQITQEHSYVPQMWRIIRPPDLLIYLDAPYELCADRKQLNWSEAEYNEQLRRLAHAKQHCDLYLNTEELSISDVLEQTMEWLGSRHVQPSEQDSLT
jgi:cytidylate kinase